MSKKLKPTTDPTAIEHARPSMGDEDRIERGADWPGAAGFRTRAGRTGLDPFDSFLELAHEWGLFFKRLFTGRLTTRQPGRLALLGAAGGLLLAPWVLVVAAPAPPGEKLAAGLFFAPAGIVGMALVATVMASLADNRSHHRGRAGHSR
jgi:hypothetical protein